MKSALNIFSVLADQNLDRLKAFSSTNPVAVDDLMEGGHTPLMYAAEYDKSYTDVLLEHGARIDDSDDAGRTAIHWAVYFENVEVVERLLNAGANPNKAACLDDLEILRTLAEQRVGHVVGYRPLSLIDWTPLHMAALGNSPKVLALLLRAGADSECSTLDGLQPLHFVDYHSYPQAAAMLRNAVVAKKLRTIEPADSAGTAIEK